MSADLIIGDVFDVLATIPDGSVDLVLTSPPFLALRSYLPADHPDKAKEIGSEPTPAAFIDTLLALSAEWRRVLAPHGSIAIELGDTYSGARGYGNEESQNPAYGERSTERWEEARVTKRFKKADDGWPDAKSLCLIPELYRLGLAYGVNPLTGQPSPAGRWRVRNVVRWCRPNPPVGALGDKFRPGTSDMVIACTSARRYFDLEAVRHDNPRSDEDPGGYRMVSGKPSHDAGPRSQNPAGAPPLDWWQISTEAYAGSHYATWPRKLLERPIKAMVPRKVCRTCGEPSRRIVEADYGGATWPSGGDRNGLARQSERIDLPYAGTTLGWTDCGHNDWRPGVVLEPFAGSGTTLAVATGHGHHAIGIDIDARNADLARERVGALLLTEWTLDEWKNK